MQSNLIEEGKKMTKVAKKEQKLKSIDFTLCITMLILLALGIVMVLSASSPSALAESGNSYSYVYKQGLSAIIGLVAMVIISRIDYRNYRKLYKLAYIGSVGLLALVPIIGTSINGAKRWITLPIFGQFQPSELAKIGLIVFFAAYLANNKDKLKTTMGGFVKPLIWLAIPIFILIVFQDHLSASIVIAGIVAIMMIIAGTRIRDFLTVGLGVGGLGAAAIVLMPKITGKGSFRIDRIASFLNPWADTTGDSWQIIQSLYAIGSGGLFGVGLGQSKQKYLYLPYPHNDFIFAVLAEELGFVGCAIVIILFAVFVWRGILIAMKAPDMFGSLLAIGITAMIGLQAIINIAVVTNSIPVTGMALPFFSYGGTSLVILLCSVGVLLNISRYSKKA